MKVLVTGGTGLVGRHLVLRLRAHGHTVTAIGRNRRVGEELRSRGVDFIAADLADLSAIRSVFAGHQWVVHAGALNARWGKYEEYYRANVLGTRNVIESCFAHGVARLVSLSTPSIYFDYRNREGIKESDPLPRPRTFYAATKRLADELVDSATRRGLSCLTLRPRAIMGPGDRNVLGRTLKAARKGSLRLPDGGRALVDLTEIENVLDAVELALHAPDSLSGKTFNITNGEAMTSRQMVERVAQSLGLPLEIRSVPFPLAYLVAGGAEFFHGGVLRREPPFTRDVVGLMARSQTLDISAARVQLGYRPRVSLAEGFERYARWWKTSTAPGATFAQWLGI